MNPFRPKQKGQKLLPRHSLLLMIAILLGGCAPAPADPSLGANDDLFAFFDSPEHAREFALQNGHTLMAAVLEDSTVSREEYQQVFDQWLRCREQLGWTHLGEPIWNPTDRQNLVVDSLPPDGQVTPELVAADNRCGAAFHYVHLLFQGSTPPETEPALLTAIEGCLEANEIPFKGGGSSLFEIIGPDPANSPDFPQIEQCIRKEHERLYPDLHTWTLRL